MSAKLFLKTPLRPKPRSDTRKSSTYEMLRRHAQLREHVVKLGDAEIDAPLLNPAVERKVDYMLK